jgi:hypothetical protein
MSEHQVGKIAFGSSGTQVFEIKVPPFAAGPWQLMKYAPRDGTTVLLEWDGGGEFAIGFWDTGGKPKDKKSWILPDFEEGLSDSNFQRFALIIR